MKNEKKKKKNNNLSAYVSAYVRGDEIKYEQLHKLSIFFFFLSF